MRRTAHSTSGQGQRSLEPPARVQIPHALLGGPRAPAPSPAARGRSTGLSPAVGHGALDEKRRVGGPSSRVITGSSPVRATAGWWRWTHARVMIWRRRSTRMPAPTSRPHRTGRRPGRPGRSPVAQLAECPAVNRWVTGSIPVGGATRSWGCSSAEQSTGPSTRRSGVRVPSVSLQ